MRFCRIVFLAFLIFNLPAFSQSSAQKSEILKGWLSDEHCASSKAREGIYEATNPDCARECVAKGYKIVLIDPKQKRILVISNQSAATENLGDYVEIQGEIDSSAGTLQIDSIKLLKKGKSAPSTSGKKSGSAGSR
jgi:hypothetical protein